VLSGRSPDYVYTGGVSGLAAIPGQLGEISECNVQCCECYIWAFLGRFESASYTSPGGRVAVAPAFQSFSPSSWMRGVCPWLNHLARSCVRRPLSDGFCPPWAEERVRRLAVIRPARGRGWDRGWFPARTVRTPRRSGPLTRRRWLRTVFLPQRISGIKFHKLKLGGARHKGPTLISRRGSPSGLQRISGKTFQKRTPGRRTAV
jgi:hypothetical protein